LSLLAPSSVSCCWHNPHHRLNNRIKAPATINTANQNTDDERSNRMPTEGVYRAGYRFGGTGFGRCRTHPYLFDDASEWAI